MTHLQISGTSSKSVFFCFCFFFSFLELWCDLVNTGVLGVHLQQSPAHTRPLSKLGWVAQGLVYLDFEVFEDGDSPASFSGSLF